MSEDIGMGGAQLVAAGNTLIQTTHREMRAVSVQAPRDLEKVLQAVIKEIECVPAWAQNGYYDRPIGDGKNIIGASVVLTRIVARNFGNCSVRSYLFGQSGDEEVQTYQLAGQFIDLQTNYSIERMFPVSSMAWRRSSRSYVLLEGEKMMQAILIGASKAERNAVQAAVPDFIMQSAFEKCRLIAADTVKQTLSATVEWFFRQGVTREMLERELGGTSLDKLDTDQLARMKGLGNAIRDREMRPSEIGGRDEEQPEEDAAATVEEVIKGGATTTGGRTAGKVKLVAEPADETVEQESEEPATQAGDDESNDDGWY